MNPMTPHFRRNMEMSGEKIPLSYSDWPLVNEEFLSEDLFTLPVQINGKRRAEIKVKKDLDQDTIKSAALNNELIKKYLKGSMPKKIIVVRRIVNIVS